MKVKDFFCFDKMLWKDYIKVTVPILLTNGLWGINTAMQTAILGHMTAAAIAANSAASNLFLLVKSTAVGASTAAGVLIGKAIGYGDMERVKEYAKRLQKLFLGIGICSRNFIVLPTDSGAVIVRSATGNEGDGKYIFDHFECGGYRNVLPDADQHRDHPRRRRCDVCRENGSDQYLANRTSAFFLYGI